jgi:hypothetical protein
VKLNATVPLHAGIALPLTEADCLFLKTIRISRS